MKLSTEALDILGRAKSLGIHIRLDKYDVRPIPLSVLEQQRRRQLGIEIGRQLDAKHIIQSATYAGRWPGDPLYDPICAWDTWTTELTFMPTVDYQRLVNLVTELHGQLKDLNR